MSIEKELSKNVYFEYEACVEGDDPVSTELQEHHQRQRDQGGAPQPGLRQVSEWELCLPLLTSLSHLWIRVQADQGKGGNLVLVFG